MNNYGDKGQGNFYKVRSGSVFFESDPNPDLANLNPDPQPWLRVWLRDPRAKEVH